MAASPLRPRLCLLSAFHPLLPAEGSVAAVEVGQAPSPGVSGQCLSRLFSVLLSPALQSSTHSPSFACGKILRSCDGEGVSSQHSKDAGLGVPTPACVTLAAGYSHARLHHMTALQPGGASCQLQTPTSRCRHQVKGLPLAPGCRCHTSAQLWCAIVEGTLGFA